MRTILLAAILIVACGPGQGTPSPTPATSGSAAPLPDASATGAAAGSLPQGAGVVALTSAPVATAPPPPTPTPTPDPAVWRFEGRVVDPDGKPLPGVCVVIGPRGCQRGSPRTGERGMYLIDLPQVATVTYDLYFVREGYLTVWRQLQPQEPTVFNVILRRPGG